MYGSEVTWRGQKSMSRTFQKNINRMARATLGVLPSTPVAFLQAEGGSIPAEARLDGRQEAFAIRLASKEEPADGLLRTATGLGSRLGGMIDGGGKGVVRRIEQVGCGRGLSFPGEIVIPAEYRGKRETKEAIEAAVARANDMETDTGTIWTDGSKLEDGRVGVGMAWFEDPEDGTNDTNEKTEIARRDYRTAGQRREGRSETYLGGLCTIRRNGGRRWRSDGFRLGGGQEAYDAEVAAIVYGLQLHGRDDRGRNYTIFTDSVAAMKRARGDAPGPGQEMAVRAIEIAERLVRQGNTVTIRWTPAHKGVEGNERADQVAKEAATFPPLRGTRGRFSLAFLKRRITDRTTTRWITDTTTKTKEKGRGGGAFEAPGRMARPRIRPLLRTTRKGVASRYFQLLSGHAMIAPFLRDKWGWTDTDRCWWC